MLRLDQDEMKITCPQGDTGLLLIRINGMDGQPLSELLDGVVIFAVCKELKNGTFTTESSKSVEIVDNTVTINITNSFSRGIQPGDYRWDVRIVTDPEYDDDDNVICMDDSDEVHSLFAGREGGMPKYIVPGVAVDV